jgi:hypothetical protein
MRFSFYGLLSFTRKANAIMRRAESKLPAKRSH